jgi:DsbC/DsbD-like thiol-disulfide interchange protein
MNRLSTLGLLVAGFVMVLALLLPAQAGEKFDNLVKVSATATKLAADGTQTVTFTFTIEKGWYIYANPVGDKEYEANRTTIAISAKEKLTADVKYPATDKLSKFNHKIYEKSVVIQSQVKRTPGDTSPLQASIDINVCSHGGKCLPTNTVKLSIP